MLFRTWFLKPLIWLSSLLLLIVATKFWYSEPKSLVVSFGSELRAWLIAEIALFLIWEIFGGISGPSGPREVVVNLIVPLNFGSKNITKFLKFTATSGLVLSI